MNLLRKVKKIKNATKAQDTKSHKMTYICNLKME
jgi:hypothetical protein